MGMKASSGFFHGTNGDLRFKLDIQFFTSSNNGLFSSTGHVSERSISKNRDFFYEKSPSEIAGALNEQGYKTMIRPSKHATSKAKAVVVGNSDKHRNITQILVSPGTPRHGNVPYVKISTNDGGRFKVINGTKSEYKTDGNENAKLFFRRRKK